MSDSVTPWTAARQASLSITNSLSLSKLMSIESVIDSNHLILYCPLLLLPSIFPSIRVFSSESALYIRWPKYWSFSISPSDEYSGLNSFRIDWFDLLAVQGTLKSLFQHHSLKASILLIENIKTFDYKDLCWQSNVSALNMLSRLVIAFLPRSKHLISWLQSPSAVIFESKKIKSLTVSPSICPEVMGPDAMILVF